MFKLDLPLCVLVIFSICTCRAMADDQFSIKVIPPDKFLKMTGWDSTSIFIDGTFDQSSPSKVQEAIDQVKSGSIMFHFNSGGGNLLAGMQIGRLIRKAGAQTYVHKYKSPNKTSVDNTDPGVCLSACSLAFLGGVYRYVDQKSVYGVHRFSSKKTDTDDLDTAQIVSAAITNYITEMGASPELFSKMVEAGSQEIRVLSDEELRNLKVTTGGTKEAKWSIEAIEGGMYLRGMQDSVWGFGKLVFACSSKGIVMQSVYEAGERAKEISKTANYNTFKIDSENLPLPEGHRFLNEGYINNIHLLPREYVEKISSAKSIGYSMQFTEASPVFWGFAIDIGEKRNRDLIKNYLNNCSAKLN